MNVSILKSGMLLFFVALLWTGCQKDDLPIVSNGPAFDIDQFEQNLQDALDGNVTGYAYTITKKGNLYTDGAGGWAVVGGSAAPGIEQSPNKRMTIASISKPITAVAALRVMEEHNVSLDEPFVKYVPSNWTVHASMNDITLKQLLQHRSGIKSGGNDFEGLKEIVENGVQPAHKGNYDYNNANFGMFRIILPYIMVPQQVANVENNESSLDALTALHFIDYIRWQMFEPIGIEDAKLMPDESNPTLCYNFDDTSNPWLTADYSFSAGAFGWYLSTNDLANFWAHTLYDNDFLSEEQREQMKDGLLGLKDVTGDHGKYIGHGGDWYSGGADGRGMTGAILSFPNQVEVSLLINCRAGNHSSKYTLLKNAFDNAWE
jgi:CubicO group peptidase (beta-lactamase class C family)